MFNINHPQPLFEDNDYDDLFAQAQQQAIERVEQQNFISINNIFRKSNLR